MNYRFAKVSITLMLAGLFSFGLLNMSACDPCHSCGHGTPAPTHTKPTKTATPSSTATPAPNACLPSSSIGVLVQGTNATAYVPQGEWSGAGTAAIAVVPIETSGGIGTGGAASNITTPNIPNSCACNSDTGETVCVADNTDVYLITGTTLNSTLTSGSDSQETFSGGTCNNCGVVVDSTTNRALITMGLSTNGPGGYQFLDLGSTPAFETPFGAGTDVSEDVSLDPHLHYILSPNEGSLYQIVNTSGSTPAIFNNDLSTTPQRGEYDSAGEDCTTGIALATDEFTGDLLLADLTQASFTPGTPGTWTDTAINLENFPEFSALVSDAGTCGVAVAPGTHLAIVTSEFGGNAEGIVQLPSTSGSGTPAAVDWVEYTMPDEPGSVPFGMGGDPHTVTAYVSPNTHKAYAVLGDSTFCYVGIVDLQALLGAPRSGHTVTSIPAGAVTYIPQQGTACSGG